MPDNHVLPPSFNVALTLGQLNEQVIAHEFAYKDVPLIKSGEGKQDFDYFLPDGRSIEIKLDLRSQATKHAALETKTMKREADIHIHTLTYAVVLTREQVDWLYSKGKIAQMGGYRHQDRYVPVSEMRNVGMYLDTFIRQLKQDNEGYLLEKTKW